MLCWPSSRLKRVIVFTSIMMFTFFLVVILALVHTNSQAETLSKCEEGVLSGDYQLRMVHMVFRHGQRTAADTYPNDPFINETFTPYGWGQLTNNGKLQLYDIGKWARKRYDTLLGSTFSTDQVHAQATGVTRTQMSVALVLAALFPPVGTPLEWNKGLDWQPVPYTFESLDQDKLLLVRIPCPRYHEALEEVFNFPHVKEYLESNKQLMQELTEITGLDIKTPDDVQSLYSTLKAEKEYGIELPTWTSKYFPEKLQNLTDESYILNVYTDELKRIKGGPFLKKTLNEWKNAKLSKKQPKIFVYAGHDGSVVNILSAFNVWKPQFPDYAIMGVFELYENTVSGEWVVQILSKLPDKSPDILTIPGCEALCSVEKLESLLKNHIPKDDFSIECKANDENITVPPLGGP